MANETRPAENKTARVQLLMSPSEVEAIDDWGFANRIRTRAEALRRLASLGLHQQAAADLAAAATAVAMRALSKEPLNKDEVSAFVKALEGNVFAQKKRTKFALDSHADLLVIIHMDRNKDRKLSSDQAREEIADEIAAVYQADADFAKKWDMELAKRASKPLSNEPRDSIPFEAETHNLPPPGGDDEA